MSALPQLAAPTQVGPYHQAYGSLAAKWKDDPIAFFHDALGIDGEMGTPKLTDDQIRLVWAIVKNRRVACTAGNSVGKSYVIAAIVLWFLYTNEDCFVITTASSWEQVENVLWREIREMHKRSKIPLGGELLDFSLELGEKWAAFGLSTNKPTRFQGKHAKRVLIIYDEATGIDGSIFEAGGSMAGGPQDRQLAVGNPTDATSAFYEECLKPGKWVTMEISALDHPNVVTGKIMIPGAVTREQVEDFRRDYGEDHPVYEARVLGRWSKKIGRMFPDFEPAVGGRHVYDPQTLAARDYWPRWIAIDWGFAHNMVALFAAFDGRKTYIYDEIVLNGKTSSQFGLLVAERANPPNPLAPNDHPNANIHTVYLAHDAFSRVDGNRTRADEMGAVFVEWGLPFPIIASRDRVGGCNLITTMFRTDTLVVSAKCTSLIAKIQKAMRDPKKPEDMLKVEGDDEADALYKLVASRPAEPVIPREVQIDNRIADMQKVLGLKPENVDPNTRAMQARLAASEVGEGDAAFASMRRGWR